MRSLFAVLAMLGFAPLAALALAPPTTNVTLPANGCAAAIPSDGLDDLAALQCHVDWLSTTHGGGVAEFPSGTYDVTATLQVPGNVMLKGHMAPITIIQTLGYADVTAISYNGTNNNEGGMRDIGVYCSQSTVATQACVKVPHNLRVTFKDFRIWGGCYALMQDGVDGYMENGIVAGMARSCGHLMTHGANWYMRVKFNAYAGQTVTYGVAINTWVQSPNNGLQENRFVESDISGPVDYSLAIYDAGKKQQITSFIGGTISGPISAFAARVTTISDTGLGSPSLFSASPIVLTGNYQVNGNVTVTGSGARSCAGNSGVFC